jgi:histidinol-phosphatase
MAALDIIVREAGGRFTSLAGQPGPWGPNALATNGRLHDAAMAYLGHFPDDGPPDASWTDEPEDALEEPTTGDDNVRTLDFSRSWGDPDAP